MEIIFIDTENRRVYSVFLRTREGTGDSLLTMSAVELSCDSNCDDSVHFGNFKHFYVSTDCTSNKCGGQING